MITWVRTGLEHVRNLTGRIASDDQHRMLLYLTMRFARTIRNITNMQVYHAGEKLMVETTVGVDENILGRDSHDLAESLQYVLESVPAVDRAFVEVDYIRDSPPTHMDQFV